MRLRLPALTSKKVGSGCLLRLRNTLYDPTHSVRIRIRKLLAVGSNIGYKTSGANLDLKEPNHLAGSEIIVFDLEPDPKCTFKYWY